MKKLISLILALVMVFALATTAFAATIAVQDVLAGETYTAYKILNYTHSGDAYSYYLTAEQYDSIGDVLEDAGFAFTASSDGTQYTVNNAKSFDAAAAAEALGGADLGDALGKFEATGADGEAVFDGLTPGYYFVTSTAGSLCALHSDEEIAEVVEKNTVPTIDKTQKTGEGTFTDDAIDANIGDTVNYKIVITDGTGTNNAITMTDTMSAGLTYTAGSLKINGATVADDADTANWKVTVSGQIITIVFKEAYVTGLKEGGTITVTYDATLNASAAVDSANGNENKVKLAYSEQEAEDVKVYVQTYDFLLKKTDGTNFLDGAGFRLYDAATGGNEIKLAKDNTGYYVDAQGDVEIEVDKAEGVNIRGLTSGTYYLEETTVPAGYNKLAERQEVTIETGATAAVEVTVVNSAGSVLPSTGGIGTTLFYVIGGLLMTGAVVLLVTKKRMA